MKTMVEFMEFTSGVTWRVPLNSDGSYGAPEILRKWTSEPKKVYSKKPKKQEDVHTLDVGEVEL
jgi:hypothetical protein